VTDTIPYTETTIGNVSKESIHFRASLSGTPTSALCGLVESYREKSSTVKLNEATKVCACACVSVSTKETSKLVWPEVDTRGMYSVTGLSTCLLHPEMASAIQIIVIKNVFVFILPQWLRFPPNGPELSCGDEVPQQRNPVRAS